jgi:hypothetical protein
MRDLARVPRPGKLEQSRNPAADLRVGHAEIAAVDEEILLSGEIGVERVGLRHDAGAAPRFACLLRHRKGKHLDLSGVRIDQSQAQPQRRRLACPVGTEQAEALAALQLEIYASDDLLVAVALAQSCRSQLDDGLMGHASGPAIAPPGARNTGG